MQAINPTTTSAWSKLVALSQKHQNLSILELLIKKIDLSATAGALEIF